MSDMWYWSACREFKMGRDKNGEWWWAPSSTENWKQMYTGTDDAQTLFITTNRTYLEAITPFSMFEYEKLNSGTSLDDILKEQAFIKKFM